jgi:hypothetical protein
VSVRATLRPRLTKTAYFLLHFGSVMAELRDNYMPKDELRRQLFLALFRAAERKYGRLISEARKEWECRFAGSDPSDACVAVRISGIDSRQLARFFPLEYSRQSQSLVSN